MATPEELKRILRTLANAPAELTITKRLHDELASTDYELGDPEAMFVVLITAIAELETALRGPKR